VDRPRRGDTHDLLPLPYTASGGARRRSRFSRVSRRLGSPSRPRDPSTYFSNDFLPSTMPNWECFPLRASPTIGLRDLLTLTTSSSGRSNPAVDPKVYLDAVPFYRVVQLHVGGTRTTDALAIPTSACDRSGVRLLADVLRTRGHVHCALDGTPKSRASKRPTPKPSPREDVHRARITIALPEPQRSAEAVVAERSSATPSRFGRVKPVHRMESSTTPTRLTTSSAGSDAI